MLEPVRMWILLREMSTGLRAIGAVPINILCDDARVVVCLVSCLGE
jgi:hypothetical protein